MSILRKIKERIKPKKFWGKTEHVQTGLRNREGKKISAIIYNYPIRKLTQEEIEEAEDFDFLPWFFDL